VRAAAASALVAACLLVACGSADTGSPPPQAAPTTIDLAGSQPHQLYTHCGVVWTQFQGQVWYADPPQVDAAGNPPAGFGDPVDNGTMRRISAHQAEYVSSSGKVVAFSDTEPPGASPPGLCS
jgi:hypothetical protein